ncbi:30S ribosomal protein S7 [Alienimonas californiensis]|uniref:Small ribosomal subunit protein uS7 n=1 Tax=Alienimonas californiensis TaxID=2527989 RepID=A0A517P8H1_9PLAN|nr:30S ribosomal protein S7 [Alienimonas californiensis]QDT15667.1 30S ribosomal protein S7 [Alienimonas californiensis]
MSKSYTASRKQLKPDPRYNSLLASKFVNCLMYDGKKSTAFQVFYDALDRIQERMPRTEPTAEDAEGKELSPIDVFHKAVENIKPAIEVRSKRVGGATYQVPTPVSPKRQQTLAIRWLLESVRSKKGRPTHLSLSDELMAAYKREGVAMTKRENIHKMADANKAFAHFAY